MGTYKEKNENEIHENYDVDFCHNFNGNTSFTLVNVNYVFFNNKGLSWNNNLQNNPDLVITDKSVKGLVNSVATAVGLETPSKDTDFIYLDKATANESYPYNYVRSSDISYTYSESNQGLFSYGMGFLFACQYVINNNPDSFFC